MSKATDIFHRKRYPQHFREGKTTSVYHWKGTASYYMFVVGDLENIDAAYYYPDPKPAAANIAGK